ncbi:hypothetical protein ACGFNU_10680 [Spirillospora sp. NPDC048911]|uniref:hypothetical protein n=1 Tax=Spirillospora sp. NPDC048911 TaxID=3364527 RepID=UPI00371A94D6
MGRKRTSNARLVSLGTGLILAGTVVAPAHSAIAETAPRTERTTATTPASSAAQFAVSTAKASVTSASVAKERSWQKWGPWRKLNRVNWCRTYVDATTKGSRILFSGAVFCKRPSAAIAMNLGTVPGGGKSRFCNLQVFKTEGFCYLQKWRNNPRGKQTFRAATTANNLGLRLPHANIVFKA